MFEKFTSLSAAVLTTVALFAATAPAHAQDRVTVIATEERAPVRLVSYRDLNLARSERRSDPRRSRALCRARRLPRVGALFDGAIRA